MPENSVCRATVVVSQAVLHLALYIAYSIHVLKLLITLTAEQVADIAHSRASYVGQCNTASAHLLINVLFYTCRHFQRHLAVAETFSF